jgi:hypothetical protein
MRIRTTLAFNAVKESQVNKSKTGFPWYEVKTDQVSNDKEDPCEKLPKLNQ